MRPKPCLNFKAVFALVAGIAFFLTTCRPITVREKPPGEAREDYFALAERNFEEGNYRKALEDYGLYLEKNPTGEKSIRALYRMALIYNKSKSHAVALTLLQRIIREYPDHHDIPLVKYKVASTYSQLKKYRRSNDEVSEWVERYPHHLLMGEVLYLKGKNFREMGDDPEALYWWIRSAQTLHDFSEKKREISADISRLIDDSRLDTLIKMEKYTAGTQYESQVLYRIGSLYLNEDRLPEAKDSAMALIQSASDEHWILSGRMMLDKINELLSVNKGVLGCLLPLSGPFAIYGQEVLNGIQMGMDLFKTSEREKEIELVIKDTGGNVEDAVSGVEDLTKKEKVMAIIGPLVSKPSVAASRKAQELGVPMITLTQKEGITGEGEMVYRNFLIPSREVTRLLEKAMNEMGLKKFAILYPENSYGIYFMNLFWDRVEKMGGVITAVEPYKLEETDFAVQIKKMAGLYYPRPSSVRSMVEEMKALGAEEKIEFGSESDEKLDPVVDFDAVFIPDSYQRVALIAPQFPFYNVFDIRFLGTRLWQSPDLIEMAGTYLQGAVFTSGFFEKSKSHDVREFVELYRENFDSEPGILAANGYDTIRFIRNFIEKDTVRTRKDFIKELSQVHDFYGVTGRISFNLEGEVEKEPILLTIAGKRFNVLP